MASQKSLFLGNFSSLSRSIPSKCKKIWIEAYACLYLPILLKLPFKGYQDCKALRIRRKGLLERLLRTWKSFQFCPLPLKCSILWLTLSQHSWRDFGLNFFKVGEFVLKLIQYKNGVKISWLVEYLQILSNLAPLFSGTKSANILQPWNCKCSSFLMKNEIYHSFHGI